MEILLDAIGDYIQKHVSWRCLRYVLLAIIFTLGCALAYMEWTTRFGS
jgi:hypothetical protein